MLLGIGFQILGHILFPEKDVEPYPQGRKYKL